MTFGLLPAEVAPTAPTVDLTRSEPTSGTEGEDTRPGIVRRSSDGLFYVRLRANGASVRCLIDTGASDLVLSSREAGHVGLAPGDASYGHRIVTAGGQRPAARVRLQTIDVVGHRFRQVPLVLVKGDAQPCLMGQNLLVRLDEVAIRGGAMSLR